MGDGRPPDGLDAVKRMPLAGIAARWGYVRDPAASTRNSPVLRGDGLPRLVLQLRPNGHWVYFDTLDTEDNGTAVDFLLRRGWSFARIRALGGAPPPPARSYADIWAAAAPETGPLARRGIEERTMRAYAPLIRRGADGRVLFAHRDSGRILTGFEIDPPDGPRRFAAGGRRALFALRAEPARSLHTLVVTESAVDALSLAQIDGCPPGTAILSTAGAPSKRQCGQLQTAVERLPALSSLVLAQDADPAGDRQAEAIADALDLPERLELQRRRPDGAKDWNELVATPRNGRAPQRCPPRSPRDPPDSAARSASRGCPTGAAAPEAPDGASGQDPQPRRRRRAAAERKERRP